MSRLFCLCLFSAWLYGCSGQEQVPPRIIPPKKMELVLWDYLKADAYCSNYVKKDTLQNDSMVNVLMQQKIFEHYHISKEDFYNSYQYYISHPTVMTAVIDSMVAHQRKSVRLFDAK